MWKQSAKIEIFIIIQQPFISLKIHQHNMQPISQVIQNLLLSIYNFSVEKPCERIIVKTGRDMQSACT